MGFYFKNKFSEDDNVFPKAKLGQCKKLPISVRIRKRSLDPVVRKRLARDKKNSK